MMLQTILVGMDWGETVDAVAETAAELAVVLEASLKAIYIEDVELLRATERPPTPALPPAGTIPFDLPSAEQLQEEFQNEERVLGKRFLRLVADTRIRGSFLVARGEVAPLLIQESRAHDLLVMGKYSEHPVEDGTGRRPLGQNVEQILRKVWCPALIVPPRGELGSRYLVAYDGSYASHRALAATVRLARATRAEMEVVTVASPVLSETLREEALAYLESHHAGLQIVSLEGDPVERILDEAWEWKADLVSMGLAGADRRKGSFDPVTTAEVLHELDRPLLICGPNEEE